MATTLATTGNRLEGKVALVTGAAGGIGSAITRRFVAEGARVAAADLSIDAINTTFGATLPADRLLACRLDVTSEDSCRSAVAEIERTYGRIDIVINNAGIYPMAAIEDITLAEWRRVMAVNLEGVFLVTKSVVPIMKRQRSGRIISMSSGTIFKGTARFTHYVASKMGVVGFTRSLASELGEFGITVNAISPGLTLTDTVARSMPKALLELRLSERPLKRHEVAEDLVGATLFLASDDASFITGQTINVDGGVSFH